MIKRATLWIAALLLAGQLCAQGASKPWYLGDPGPAYQVLVYSFADSNGDGWGDLNGLAAKLDYLNDGQAGSGQSLGVSALWLSPINPSASYHGYDVTDYQAVNPRLGTLADFDRLVAAAHRRGIRIVLDMVFNHTSSQHPWFQALLKDPAGPYGNWYVRKDPQVSYGSGGMGSWYTRKALNGESISYFSAFWDQMPDLNAGNPAVVAEFRQILAFWLAHGVDGFRFDAAPHVFDTNELPQGVNSLAANKAFWADLRSYARGIRPDVWFIGEVMSNSSPEIRSYGASLDTLFDFPGAKSLLALPFNAQDSGLAKTLASNFSQYARAENFVPAPILSNHDQDRAMSLNLNLAGASAVFGWAPEAGDSPAILQGKRQGLNRSRLMAAMIQTLPGLPFMYYGEELGMVGRRYANDDISRRDAFPWGTIGTTSWQAASGKLEPGNNRATPAAAAQAGDPASLLSLYRRLALLRQQQPLLARSAMTATSWPGFNQGPIVSWLRGQGEGQLLVIHNLGEASQTLALPAGTALRLVFDSGSIDASGFRQAQPAAAAGDAAIQGQLTIPGSSSQVWLVLSFKS